MRPPPRVRTHCLAQVTLLLAGLQVGPPGQNPGREIKYRYIEDGEQVLPIFERGYLFLIRPRHSLTFYDREGNQLFSSGLEFNPGAKTIILAAAIDPEEQRLGVAVASRGEDGILLLDRSGKIRGRINTTPYQPMALCFADDQSLWTLGWTAVPASDSEKVVRKYSRDGRHFEEYLPKSSLAGLGPGVRVTAPRIRSARGRIGVLTYPKTMPEGRAEWTELTPSGEIAGHWALRLPIRDVGPGIAYTASGDLLTADFVAESKLWRVLKFDRDSAGWTDTGAEFRPDAPVGSVSVLGVFGEDLAYAVHRPGEFALRVLRLGPKP